MTSQIAAFDFETASEAGYVWHAPTGKWKPPQGGRLKGLPTVGAAAYAEHPSTRVLTLSYRLPGHPVRRWKPSQRAATVVHKARPHDVYIGRPSKWGNPFEIGRDGTRAEVISKYRAWLFAQPKLMHEARSLSGKTLGCWCTPQACHGDVLAEVAALPWDLFDHLAAGGLLEAHNVMFERLIWHHVCTRLYGWPDLEPFQYQLRCSMATARVNSLPGALANLGDVLGLDTKKDADGKRLLDKFSMPRNPTKADPRIWITLDDDPVDAERLYAYCDRDVASETAASDAMLPMTADELRFWLIDQEINMRGIGLDRAAVRDCIVVLEQALAHYGEEFRVLTGAMRDAEGRLVGGLNPTQLEATKGWLLAQGVAMTTMDEAALDEALARDDLPAPARRALEIRQRIGSASVKKLYAMENTASADDRIRNTIIHHGARTGRPTGDLVQPLNLPKSGPDLLWCGSCARPAADRHTFCPWCAAPTTDAKRGEWKAEAVDSVLETFAHRDLGLVEWFWGDALLSISGCIRSLFVAAPGHDLIASDFSSIEAVVLAQLAGERWRIEAFERGDPIYLVGAAKITGRDLQFYLDWKERTGAHHEDRQKIGKVSELACFTADTRVLTRRGYVAIVDVRKNDELWDGVEWVNHQGVVPKGSRGVLRLDGVGMTPDHEIICDGSWKAARELASSPSTLSRALASGSANLPSSATTARRRFGSDALAVLPSIRLRRATFAPVARRDATPALNAPLAWLEKITGPTPISFLTTRTAGVSLIASRRALPAATPKATRITEGGESAWSLRIAGASSRIWSPWMGGTTPLSNSTESTATATTLRETSASSLGERTCETSDPSKRCSAASTSLKPVFDIAHAGPRNRFTIRTDSGHLIVHNCGYGGWVGSYKAFGSQEPDDVIKQQILGWRAASPSIPEFWGGQWRGMPWEPGNHAELYGVEGHAIAAIQNPGAVYEFRGLRFYVRDNALRITLLSGRELTYHSPRLVPTERLGRPEVKIIYWTWNSNPKYGAMGWGPMETYGGRLTENIVQAVAHDILRYAIENLRAAGYPTVLHVYDEIIVEVPHGAGSIEEVERIMGTMPLWAVDSKTWRPWPIRAEGGWRGRRYRKG